MAVSRPSLEAPPGLGGAFLFITAVSSEGPNNETGAQVMPKGKFPTETLELDVPIYLPLSEAAGRYNLSENVLTQLIQAGKIEAVRLPSGEVLVPANNDPQKIRT